MTNIPPRQLKDVGLTLPPIGQGTMGIGGYYGKDGTRDAEWITGLRRGIDLGLTLIDTAEVYGAGHSEELVGRAIKEVRDEVFIVSKFSAEHSRAAQVIAAAEGSLRRLGTDRIDLYQPHWPNPSVPFEETAEALGALVQSGKVRFVGLSNFSFPEMQKTATLLNPIPVPILQQEYNLIDRTIEEQFLTHCDATQKILLTYSPFLQGKMVPRDARKIVLDDLAKKYERTVAQVILAWLLRKERVVVIPKASTGTHVEELAAVKDLSLDVEDIQRISEAYSPGISWIPVSRISLQGGGYTTSEEALANPQGFDPSPQDLAQSILMGNMLKPIKVTQGTTENAYFLTEGKIRFWAWVLAYERHSMIPAFVEECPERQSRIMESGDKAGRFIQPFAMNRTARIQKKVIGA
ncbi:MAG TPA: aldo/keto reductase [Nitrospirales bacterium]|nr:aldo/keto reductase [Nitrospirales bacterium]